MQLDHAFRLLDTSDEFASRRERRTLHGELRFIRLDSSEPNRRRYPAVACARGCVGNQSAVRTRERLNRLACSLQPLPESGGFEVEGVGGFRRRQVQDFAKHVSDSMWPIQALKHSECAADLHLLR